jgi:hypothetical protein
VRAFVVSGSHIPLSHKPKTLYNTGLHSTLLVRHPDDGRLYVNLDQQIPELIREAKCLERLGVEVCAWSMYAHM